MKKSKTENKLQSKERQKIIYELEKDKPLNQMPSSQQLFIKLNNTPYDASKSTCIRDYKKVKKQLEKEHAELYNKIVLDEPIEILDVFSRPIILKITPIKLLLLENLLLEKFNKKIVTIPQRDTLLVYIIKPKKETLKNTTSSNNSNDKNTAYKKYEKELRSQIKTFVKGTVIYATTPQQKN